MLKLDLEAAKDATIPDVLAADGESVSDAPAAAAPAPQAEAAPAEEKKPAASAAPG